MEIWQLKVCGDLLDCIEDINFFSSLSTYIAAVQISSNSTGDNKVRLLVIGHASKARCFAKNKFAVNDYVHYAGNKTARPEQFSKIGLITSLFLVYGFIPKNGNRTKGITVDGKYSLPSH
ncbi:hypothetical protein ACFFRR_005620 [Megaselia abdita]